MKENTQDKSMIKIKENSIFYKIKNFFKSLFSKKESITDVPYLNELEEITIEKKEIKNDFMEYIGKIEDEETKLLKLQKQYRSGAIKGEELTKEQIIALGKLYDKQIAALSKSNEIEKKKLLEYRRKLQEKK